MTTAQANAMLTIMCSAIDKAHDLYCEILAQRYEGMNVMGRTYDRLADLDRQALRTIEAYDRTLTQEATR